VPPDGIDRAYVLENEITYLAFPVPPAAMAILGGGYAVSLLESFISNAYGPSVRLEQEKVRFSAIQTAVADS
jgi:hypothetical protein